MLQALFSKKCSLEKVDLDEIAVKTEGFVAQDFVDFTNKAVFESFKEGKKLIFHLLFFKISHSNQLLRLFEIVLLEL